MLKLAMSQFEAGHILFLGPWETEKTLGWVCPEWEALWAGQWAPPGT